MSELHNIMQNIEVNLSDHWMRSNLYTGAKEDLIAAGLAKEYMFADLPKRVKHGFIDRNGWPIDDNSIHDDQYDWFGETRPIWWDTKRIKGGKYELSIEKSWEEKKALKNPPFTLDSFLKETTNKAIGAAIAIKILARGASDRNPEGYCLSKHHEISQLIDRVIEAVWTSTVVTTHDDKPFRVIDGDKI